MFIFVICLFKQDGSSGAIASFVKGRSSVPFLRLPFSQGVVSGDTYL